MLELLFSKILFLFLRATSGSSFPPPLSAKEEKELFAKCREGDKKAREKLIMHNLRLVSHIIKKYYTNYDDQDDLISIGTIGLIKAIDSYDVKNGTRFATYAGKCLQNEILMYFRRQKKLALETSINDNVDFDKDGNPLTYIDLISSDDDVAEEITQKIQCRAVLKAVDEALTEREKTIISYRYGLTPDGKVLAQREVAEKLDISRSYVSRIEKSALDKLNAYMKKKGITP